MAQYELDLRGMLCPMPVIKTQNKIKELSPGDELVSICTDPGALEDIPAWCRVHGHEYVGSKEDGREIFITVLIKDV